MSGCVQVVDLRTYLGVNQVPCPKMDIGSSFTSLGNKALGVSGFFPYNSDINFLLGEGCRLALHVFPMHMCF